MISWLYLLLAGAFEVGFTTLMKLSDGFSRPLYTVGFILCVTASFACMSQAIKTIPLGTAYAVWTGLGTAGTVIIGILFWGDAFHFKRIFFLLLILGGIIGLRWVEST